MTVLPRTRGYRTAAALLPQLESVLDNKLAYLEHCVYAEKSFKYCNEDGVKKMMAKIEVIIYQIWKAQENSFPVGRS